MTGQKTWVVGEEVLAPDFNNFIQTQVVAQFNTVAERDAWASPPNGALCVTLDTDTLWHRRLGVWGKPWRQPWGFIGRAVKTDAQNGIGTSITDVTGLSVTFTAVAGRLYKVSMHMFVLPPSTTGNAITYLRDGANANLSRSDVPPSAGSHAGIDQFITITPPAGAYTVKASANAGANTMNVNGVNGPATLLVEDIGPSS